MFRFLKIVILLLLAILLLGFAFANRDLVTVSFDPFASIDSAVCARLALALSSAIWNCFGSTRNSTSPAFTAWPSRTSTSLTRPDTSVDTISLVAWT